MDELKDLEDSPIGKQHKEVGRFSDFGGFDPFFKLSQEKTQKKEASPKSGLDNVFFSKHQGSAGFWYGFSDKFWVQQNHQ